MTVCSYCYQLILSDSNSRPVDYQPNALTTKLHMLIIIIIIIIITIIVIINFAGCKSMRHNRLTQWTCD